MPSYKLTYFPIKGLAEPIRFILSYAEVDFVDDRFSKDDWSSLKLTMPFGQVPVLEIDGKKHAQSVAICRYLAKKYGLAGKDDCEAFKIDITVDTIHDIRTKIGAYHYETNEEVRSEKLKVANQFLSFTLDCLDNQVKENNGYFVNGALTWADLVFVALLDYIYYMMKQDILEKYDNLKALKQKVLELPAIKKWVEKRPETEF